MFDHNGTGRHFGVHWCPLMSLRVPLWRNSVPFAVPPGGNGFPFGVPSWQNGVLSLQNAVPFDVTVGGRDYQDELKHIPNNTSYLKFR